MFLPECASLWRHQLGDTSPAKIKWERKIGAPYGFQTLSKNIDFVSFNFDACITYLYQLVGLIKPPYAMCIVLEVEVQKVTTKRCIGS